MTPEQHAAAILNLTQTTFCDYADCRDCKKGRETQHQAVLAAVKAAMVAGAAAGLAASLKVAESYRDAWQKFTIEVESDMGARRLRECIFAVLPPYLVKSAADECRYTLERGESEEPLPVRIGKLLTAFAQIGIDKARIEAKHGR